MVEASAVLQYALNGVVFGAIVALAAVGLTLVYGILGLPNFAHGELLTLGAYGAFAATVLAPPGVASQLALALAVVLALAGLAGPRVRWRGAPLLEASEGRAPLAAGVALAALALVGGGFVLAVGLAAVATAGLAAGMDLAVWAPLRRRRATTVTLVIVSIGVAFLLRNALTLQFGGDYLNYERPLELPHRIGDLTITADQIFTLGVALAMVLGVHAFLAWSRTGKALRALADNRDLARLSGVDVERMTMVVWLLAGALAAVAGALLPLNNFAVNPNVGLLLLLTTFAAVVLGGIGNVHGAMLGGLVLGVAMELTAGVWRAEYKYAVGFVALIAVLLLRPQGILGGKLA